MIAGINRRSFTNVSLSLRCEVDEIKMELVVVLNQNPSKGLRSEDFPVARSVPDAGDSVHE